tara:strand:- start:327 stop:449 length:123 start_codon:yes stop_codon:yes gene_type:complete
MKKNKARQEVKKLKNKLARCITDKSIARGSNILLKNKKKK